MFPKQVPRQAAIHWRQIEGRPEVKTYSATYAEQVIEPPPPPPVKDWSHENLTSQADGSKTTFTCGQAYESGSLEVFLRGRIVIDDDFYSESDPTAGEFTLTPKDPETGDTVPVPTGDEIFVRYVVVQA